MNAADLEKVLEQINTDFDLLNNVYGILSTAQKDLLIDDIGYLFLDNIATEIRFAFYNSGNQDVILFQYVYSSNGLQESPDAAGRIQKDSIGDIAFDVFIDFTDAFLELDSQQQDLLLKNTELEWRTFLEAGKSSGAAPG